MKKILLTIFAFIVIASGTQTVLASYDRLPEPMVGQTTAKQGDINYYGGFTGNQAVYNYTNDSIYPSGHSGQNLISTISPNEKRWVAVGMPGASLGGSIIYSSNGTDWIKASGFQFSISGYDVAWNGTSWVAVGQSNDNISIATSENGTNWSGRSSAIFTGAKCVTWNGAMWVAGGWGINSIATSPDGLIWTGRGKPGGMSYVNDVVWNGSMWIAVGTSVDGSNPNSIATSFDGINWSGQGKPANMTNINGLAWNGSMWVVVGSGGAHTIATSSDGINWTGRGKSVFSISGYGVAWNGSTWMAVGSGDVNTIATSANGINWTGEGKTVFTSVGMRVNWTGQEWAVAGQGTNNLATSVDGEEWTKWGELFNPSAYGIYSNFSLFADGNTTIRHGGNDLFGFDRNSLVLDTDGCINDIVFNRQANRCFFSNSRNGNIKVMSSRTYVNAGSNKRPVTEMAALYYPPKATLVGDAYLGSSNFNDFAYWGRNLVQGRGSGSSEAFWGLSDYTMDNLAQVNSSSDEYKQYLAKIKELQGEAKEINSSNVSSKIFLQSENINIDSVSAILEKYPNGKVWYVDRDVTLSSSVAYSGIGTIIINGDLTLNNAQNIKPVGSGDMLGIIVRGNLNLKGNNTIQAAVFSLDKETPPSDYGINFEGNNIDLIGSFVSGKVNGLTAYNNIRFYYDKRLDSGWPPGFRYLNMPHPTEN